MGARLLKRWVVFPLKDEKPINERLDVVEGFHEPDFKEFIEEKMHSFAIWNASCPRLPWDVSLRVRWFS